MNFISEKNIFFLSSYELQSVKHEIWASAQQNLQSDV